MCKKVLMTASLLSVLLAAVPLQQAHGEALWVVPESNRVLLEYLKPSFESGVDATFATSTWFLSGNVAVSDPITLTAELPYTMFGTTGGDSEIAVGNLYVGTQLQGDAPVIVELGFRLPTASKFDEASLSGTFTDWVDRMEAFIEDIVPLTAAVSYYERKDNGFIARVRGGLNFWMPVGDNEDAEVFVVYGGQVGMSASQVNLLAGLTGRWWISNEGGANAAQATMHQIALSADMPLGFVQPGVSLRLPMDDELNEIIDLTFGIHFAANFGG